MIDLESQKHASGGLYKSLFRGPWHLDPVESIMPDPLESLRGYLEWQEARGRLLRVHEPLSPILEIPSFLRHVMYQRGPTVLFENVVGHEEWRVAGNIFESLEGFREALGVERLEDIGERLVAQAQGPPPTSLREKLAKALEARELARYLPKRTRRAAFTRNTVEEDPLDSIPAFKTWPGDASRYITLGLVVTRDPVTGSTNMGVYRVMIVSGDRAVVHWQIHKRGAAAYQDAGRRGERLPVAVVLGGDPGTIFTGVAPVPPPMDKLLFAGIVRGRGLEVVEVDNGLLVPANAEAVLVGYVEPGVEAEEGPFGDHWGFYDKPVEKYPVMRVEKLYYRDDPVYPGTIVGLPPLEDAVIGKAVERIFLPLVRMILPEVVDYNLPVYAVFQGMMVVAIRKRYPGHGKKVGLALAGVGQTSLTKIFIVVDEWVDPHDYRQVTWAVSSFVDPQRDILVVHDAHTDALDPAARAPGYGSKVIVDATVKWREEAGRDPPEIVEPDPRVEERVKEVLARYGLRAADPWEELVRAYPSGTPGGYRRRVDYGRLLDW